MPFHLPFKTLARVSPQRVVVLLLRLHLTVNNLQPRLPVLVNPSLPLLPKQVLSLPLRLLPKVVSLLLELPQKVVNLQLELLAGAKVLPLMQPLHLVTLPVKQSMAGVNLPLVLLTFLDFRKEQNQQHLLSIEKHLLRTLLPPRQSRILFQNLLSFHPLMLPSPTTLSQLRI